MHGDGGSTFSLSFFVCFFVVFSNDLDLEGELVQSGRERAWGLGVTDG